MKKFISALLVSALIAAPVTAFAADVTKVGDSTIAFTTTVTNPVYKVFIPAATPFVLDPFNLNGRGQVSSPDFCIVNRSNVDVAVRAKATLTPKATVTIIGDKDVDTKIVGPVKEAYLALDMATADDGGIINLTANTAKWSYSDELVEFGPGKLEVNELNFLLAKATYDATNKITGVSIANNAAGFRYTGAISPYATWAAADLSVSIVFSISGLTTDDFDQYVTNSTDDLGGLNHYTELTYESD